MLSVPFPCVLFGLLVFRFGHGRWGEGGLFIYLFIFYLFLFLGGGMDHLDIGYFQHL